jgi:hypothetical protein
LHEDGKRQKPAAGEARAGALDEVAQVHDGWMAAAFSPIKRITHTHKNDREEHFKKIKKGFFFYFNFSI